MTTPSSENWNPNLRHPKKPRLRHPSSSRTVGRLGHQTRPKSMWSSPPSPSSPKLTVPCPSHLCRRRRGRLRSHSQTTMTDPCPPDCQKRGGSGPSARIGTVHPSRCLVSHLRISSSSKLNAPYSGCSHRRRRYRGSLIFRPHAIVRSFVFPISFNITTFFFICRCNVVISSFYD